MRLTTFLLAIGATLATAAPQDPSTQTAFKPPQPDPYEQLHQAQYGLAKALDRKDWEEVKKYMTNDIVYDNSQFQTQGRPGGRASGIANVIEATKQAFGNALVEHIVSTDKIEFKSETVAHLLTYIVYSHWDPLPQNWKDDTKTYRIWEQCDDIWERQADGQWKLHTSKVVNMGPNWELPDVRAPPKKP